MTLNNQQVQLPASAGRSYAAIDTGTTLIGGPTDVVKEIFSGIPGSAPATGDFKGYYTYPCDQPVTLSISFGGQMWTVDAEDFMLTQVSPKHCVGALFSLGMNDGSGPSWIMGDTFLVST